MASLYTATLYVIVRGYKANCCKLLDMFCVIEAAVGGSVGEI